jgi:hypothetical protein
MAILRAKYSQNASHKHALKATRGKLIEFDRSAGRVGAVVHWGGLVKDGAVIGENVMGEYMTLVRDELE